MGIQSAINKIKIDYKIAKAANSRIGNNLLGGGEITIHVRGLGNARGILKGIVRAFGGNRAGRKIIEGVAQEYVSALKKAVEPITRTGTLLRSIHYEMGDNSAVIYGASYSDTIRGASSRGKPSYQSIQSWMQHKPEFSNLSPSQEKRIAFAIAKSIRTGKGSGRTGKSSLRALSNSGEPAYDFVQVAIKQAEPELNNLGVYIGSIIE